MGRIIVIGMGSSDFSNISNRIFELINSNKKIYARTKKHEVISQLIKNNKIIFFDNLYEEAQSLDVVDKLIVNKLIKASENEDIIYLVPGSPFVLEKSVDLLINEKVELEIINNQSFADLIFSRILYVTDGYKTISGRDYNNFKVDYSIDLLIQEIDNEFLLDEIMLEIGEIYPSNTKFSIVKDGGLDTEEIYSDFIENYSRKIIPNHQTTLLIQKPENTSDFSDLLEIADTLRGPEGCPWDIEQTHASMRQDLLEEAYEVVQAIDEDDPDGLLEELGDLLFQVIMHSQIAKENGDFNIINVINGISNKLILRHPHVFEDLNLDKTSKVLQNWDSIKYSQRKFSTFWERLKDSRGLPSTIRAYKIIDKVTRIGFDWNNTGEILGKVKEEYDEVIEALENSEALREELGDLLFTVSNLCHHLGFEPELLLSEACDKFVNRFRIMEEIATEESLDIQALEKNELERLWQISKLQ